MARRRLNKKVALIGSTVLLLATMTAVVVILRLSRDPAQFIGDGDAAWAAKDYEAARKNYARAYGYSRSAAEKIDLLFKLADVYRETDQWHKVLQCWEQVITTDPANLAARLGRLKYCYLFADSLPNAAGSASGYWQEILSQATELVGVASERDVLEDPKGAWEPSFGKAEEPGWDGGIESLGAYLLLAKGRAAFELARLGAATAPADMLEQALADLQKARERDPNAAELYRLLAEVYLQKAEDAGARGDVAAQAQASRSADNILAEAVGVVGAEPAVYINQLSRKLEQAGRGNITAVRAALGTLEGEYEALVEKFPSRAEAYETLARFYSLYSMYSQPQRGAELLERAIEMSQKAVALDESSVMHTRLAAWLQYRKFSLYGDEAALSRAIALAEAGLELPDAQSTPGPQQVAKQANRLALSSFLARCCIERILGLDASVPSRTALLAKAQAAVHEIEQIRGSGENPQVVMWQGMLDLARGDTGKAVRTLYAAYEQLTASSSEERDAFLSYTLANVFRATTEIGAVIEFLGSALDSGIVDTKPQALLDYADVLLEVRSCEGALSAVNNYEERFGASARSRTLRLKTLIAAGHVTEAEEVITTLAPHDPNTLRLRLGLWDAKAAQLGRAIRQEQSEAGAGLTPEPSGVASEDRRQSVQALKIELADYRRREAEAMERLLQIDPDAVTADDLAGLCEALIDQGDSARAERLVRPFLQHSPSELTALFYQGLLSEPEPAGVSQERRARIREEAIGRIEQPLMRAVELGFFYQQREQPAKAIAQWRQVLETTASEDAPQEPLYLRTEALSSRQVAAGNLFDLARAQEDWQLAEELVELAGKDNLDDCGGRLFAGRLAFARGKNKEALAHLNDCLEQRPVFSYAYMFRGNIQAALGNAHACVEDLSRAATLNPTEPLVAKALANALYTRDKKLGDSASSEQKLQTRRALERAVGLNPRDTVLLDVYADYITASEPLKALALRQTVQGRVPSLTNAVKLGRLATQIAVREGDPERKAAFFALAESALAQARQMEPDNQFMLENYAEYYRARGQEEKAGQLLAESRDDQLLWRHYFHVGRYAEARELLHRMYGDEASRVDALKGLVLVAEETGDREGVQKHSEELLSRQDNMLNRLAQIRAYLDVGLVAEAEQKLQGFKERHPNEPRLLLMEALLAKRQGQLQRAYDLTNQNLQRDENSATAWRLRGQICLLMGDYDQAVLDFRKSRVLEDDPVTTVALAEAYMWAGRDEEAITELRSALARVGTPPEAGSLLESIYRRLGRTEARRRLYTEMLGWFPDNVEWLSRAGRFAIDQGEYGRAEELYEKAYRLKREDASGDAQMTRDLEQTAALDGYLQALVLAAGEPEAGAGAWRPEKLDRVFEVGREYADGPHAAVAFYHMAAAKNKLGDAEAAADYSRRAMDKAWQNEQVAVEVLMRLYLLMGADKVSGYCRERLAVEPNSLAANLTMFNLAKIERRYHDAVGYVDRCIELCDPQTPKAMAYTVRKAQVLTAAYEQTSDNAYLDKAIAVYESLRQKMPKNSSVLNNLAYMLAQSRRNLSEALQYAKSAVEQEPDNANFLDTYGYVLHRNGKNKEAAQSLTAAIQQYEIGGAAPAEVYEHLGRVHEALGEDARALVAYKRALEAGGAALSESVKQRLQAAIDRMEP